MPHTGCLALHGVNPIFFLKKAINYVCFKLEEKPNRIVKKSKNNFIKVKVGNSPWVLDEEN